MSIVDETLTRDVEVWFESEGVPHFIEDLADDGDPVLRSVAIMVAGFAVAYLLAARGRVSVAPIAVALIAAAVVLFALHAAVNVRRGLAAFARPIRPRSAELVSVVVPAAVAGFVVESGPGRLAGGVILGILAVGVGVFVDTFRLWRVTRWAAGQTVHQLRRVFELFGRALPLLMLFAVTLFINADVWQTAAVLGAARFWVVVGFFVLIGVVFLTLRLPGEIRDQLGPMEPAEIRSACTGTPLEDRCAELDVPDRPDELTRHQRVNLVLILMFTQIVQVALVAVMIFAFFFVFGLFAIQENVINSWVAPELGPNERITALATFTVVGQKLVITRELIRVSAFLGMLSGFYFTIYVITDKTYREDFFEQVIARVRRTIVVRSAYLALRRGQVGAA